MTASTISVYGRHTFTHLELAEKQRQLVNTIHNLELKEDEKTAVMSEFSSDIKAMNNQIRLLSKHIRDGYEQRNITCTLVKDFILKEKVYRSVMTGEVVMIEPFTESDYQMTLKDAAQASEQALDSMLAHDGMEEQPSDPPPTEVEEEIQGSDCDGCESETCEGCASYLGTDPEPEPEPEPEMEVRKCRVCGCTDENACEGGCEWVEEDLCSACSDVLYLWCPSREQRVASLICRSKCDEIETCQAFDEFNEARHKVADEAAEQTPTETVHPCISCSDRKGMHNVKKGVRIPGQFGKCTRQGGLCGLIKATGEPTSSSDAEPVSEARAAEEVSI